MQLVSIFFVIKAKGRITSMVEMTVGGHEQGLIQCNREYMESRHNACSFCIVGFATESRARIIRSGAGGGMIVIWRQ